MIGKSIYIWNIASIFGGDIARIAAVLKAARFESAILHHVNCAGWRTSDRIALVSALKDAGIEPIGGAAVYGRDPTTEGRQAAKICKDFGLKTFVFDAESAFDSVAKPDTAAVKLLQAYRSNGGERAGWCWWPLYRSPTRGTAWHPKSVLWAAMAERYGEADFGLPMTYWNWGDNAPKAVEYLETSWKQWREITDKPLCPVGRAYVGDGGVATPDAMRAFEARARELGAPGVSWWSMQHALTLPGIWEALESIGAAVEPPVDPPVPWQEWAEKIDEWARSQGYAGPRLVV